MYSIINLLSWDIHLYVFYKIIRYWKKNGKMDLSQPMYKYFLLLSWPYIEVFLNKKFRYPDFHLVYCPKTFQDTAYHAVPLVQHDQIQGLLSGDR